MGKGVAFLLVLFLLSALLPISVKPAVAVSEDSWASKSSMPTARVSFGVAVINGKIYAIGGNDGNSLNTNEMYDPETDTWTTKTQMPTPRSGFGIAVVQNKIYVIGGQSNTVYTGINEAYDPETDRWTTKNFMPTPRGGIDANVVNGKIYVIGGKTNISSITGINEVYNPATDTWTTKTPIPTPVTAYASAVVDNKIYVIGGLTSNLNEVNLTQIYDPATDTWSYGTPIPTIQFGAVGATTGISAPKRIYMLGGSIPSFSLIRVATNLTQVYDPEMDVWSTDSSMPTPRAGLCVAVVNDVLYAIGGSSVAMGTSGPPYGTNEQYTPAGYTPLPSPEPQQTEQFPTTWVTASVIIAAVASAGFLIYLRKNRRRNHGRSTDSASAF
jgi:ribosomal protein S8